MTAVQISSQVIPGTNIQIGGDGAVSALFTSQILDALLSPQVGAIPYRGPTQWTSLISGSMYYLLSVGAGGIPTWTSISASIDAGIGSGAGSMLYRGALGWATLASGTQDQLLFMGGSATPGWRSSSAQFDAAFKQLGSPPAQGSVLYRDSTAWQSLAPGEAGTVLTSNGAASNPTWNVATAVKNYIVNSGMQVSQENGATAGTVNGFYPVDQFQIASSSAVTFSAAQVAKATPGGSPNRIRVTSTSAATPAAGTYTTIRHRIEGYRFADALYGSASAKTLTLALGVNAPAGTYGVSLYNGAVNRVYVGSVTVAAGEAGTDVVKTITLPGDVTGTWAVDNTIGLTIDVCLTSAGSVQTAPASWAALTGGFLANTQTNFFANNGAVFELFDVGLYPGGAAPAFQLPEFSRELQLCMRYWEKSYAYGTPVGTVTTVGNEVILSAQTTATQTGKNTRYSVRKRAAPTVTVYSTNTGASGKFYDAVAAADVTAAVDSASELQARTYALLSGTSGCAAYFHWKVDARM